MNTINKKDLRKRFKKIIGGKKKYDWMEGDGVIIDVAYVLKEELEKCKKRKYIKIVNNVRIIRPDSTD